MLGVVIGFGSDGKSLTTLTADELLTWDLSAAMPVKRAARQLRHNNVVAISADGKTLACHSQSWSTIILWKLSESSPKPHGALPAPRHSPYSAMSPDGKMLAVSSAKGRRARVASASAITPPTSIVFAPLPDRTTPA